jgi:hypothetical protein
MMTDVAEQRDDERLASMKMRGIVFVGGRGADLFSEACKFGFRHHDYVQGVVLDRGEAKGHGLGKRYEGPFNWQGQPVYWLRKVTWHD